MEFAVKDLEVYINLAKKKEHWFIKFDFFGRMHTKKYKDSNWELMD